MTGPVDFVFDRIWKMSEMDGVIPPFCIEIALNDGNHFFLHSIPAKDEATHSLVLRIWDLRSMSEEDVTELKNALEGMCSREELVDGKALHPNLDWASLHLHIQDIHYFIEWNDKVWPREERPKFGFVR